MIFEAALQGVDLTKIVTEKLEDPVKSPVTDDVFFKDPSEYAHMTQEEKEKETKRLKGILSQMIYDPNEKTKAPRKYFSGMRI